MAKKIALIANTSWNIYNFRRGVINSLIDQGNEVLVIAPTDAYSNKLQSMGARILHWHVIGTGTSLIREVAAVFRLRTILSTEKPDVILTYTIKPNIYAGILLYFKNTRVINNITGLGSSFLRKGWITCATFALYKISLRKSHTIFFQNNADLSLFLSEKIVKKEQCRLLPGSGINLRDFPYQPATSTKRILMISRLIREKGVLEFVEAARIVKSEQPDVIFQLLGPLVNERQKRSGVRITNIKEWVSDRTIEYLSHCDDVRPMIVESSCVVLPSYREGTPRVLLEGAAIGRPLITTDVPGCRETVVNGVSGLLCRHKDAEDLANRIIQFLSRSVGERLQMGAEGRKHVESHYDEKIVIRDYLDAIQRAIDKETGEKG